MGGTGKTTDGEGERGPAGPPRRRLRGGYQSGGPTPDGLTVPPDAVTVDAVTVDDLLAGEQVLPVGLQPGRRAGGWQPEQPEHPEHPDPPGGPGESAAPRPADQAVSGQAVSGQAGPEAADQAGPARRGRPKWRGWVANRRQRP